jgi:hypothetical protein
MPDAETPVVWVMDLNDATTSVLRLESDKQGFYVIKKHGGKAAETVAVYRNRRPAVRALNAATKALDHARALRGSGGGSSRLTNILLIVLLVWFALFRFFDVDRDLIRMAVYPFVKDQLIAAQIEAMKNAQLAAPAANAPAASAAPANPATATGVPLSADDALKAQQNNAANPLMP